MTTEPSAYIRFDAHTHADDETPDFFSMQAANGTAIAVSLSWPIAHAHAALRQAASNRIFFTVGIHPWHADQGDPAALKRAFDGARRELIVRSETGGARRLSVSAVGEIGMDNVWCDVPLEIQREVFLQQLDWAQEAGLPVVLHTKGLEAEIATRIRPYKGPFLVHWYSCPHICEGFAEKDCFFSVGPDIATNRAVRRLVRATPMDRLMVETDGRQAVEWATGSRVAPEQLSEVLDDIADRIAILKGLPARDVRKAVVRNSLSFYGRAAVSAARNTPAPVSPP
jgi:TatD DNase family protein